jgi:hypothetical protein
MRMRSLSGLLVLAGLVASLSLAQADPPAGPADAAPAATEAAPPAEPAAPDISTKATTNETVAEGALPPLAGHWMVLNDLDLAGRPRTVPAFWAITEENGAPVVVERFVTLPVDLSKMLDQKNAAGEKWEPTDEQLATIQAAWDDLPDQMRGVAQVKNELWGQDAFTDQIKKEPATQDADWVVRQTYQFMPGGHRPVRQVNVFAIKEETPRGFAGSYSGAAVAMAPFPVPIPYKGSFRMIRLTATSGGGVLQRIGDWFKGCGR